MSLLYHPLSRSVNTRDLSGCLTPNNQAVEEFKYKTSELVTSAAKPSVTSNILSPPLSPYQRNNVTIHPPLVMEKLYMQTVSPFKIENYQDYKLTIDAWAELGPAYKSHQLHFLDQYSVILQEELQKKSAFLLQQRRATSTKRRAAVLDSDNESDVSTDRVRTRRVIKTTNRDMDFESGSELDSLVNLTPKKKKIRRDNTLSPSIAQQQQLLIDESIPDFSPVAEKTLPANNTKCLKIEWKGQPMDLSTDPNLSKLHPAEVVLASILRLPAAVYLDSKRRLFYEKVQRLKVGKQFRRTDAQKACRIDVNKASRLFAAFEKVGWLEDHHFQQYL